MILWHLQATRHRAPPWIYFARCAWIQVRPYRAGCVNDARRAVKRDYHTFRARTTLR